MSVVVTSSSCAIWGSARLSAKKSSCTRNIASETARRMRRSRASSPPAPLTGLWIPSSIRAARVYRPRHPSGKRTRPGARQPMVAAQRAHAGGGAAVLRGGPDDQGEAGERDDAERGDREAEKDGFQHDAAMMAGAPERPLTTASSATNDPHRLASGDDGSSPARRRPDVAAAQPHDAWARRHLPRERRAHRPP